MLSVTAAIFLYFFHYLPCDKFRLQKQQFRTAVVQTRLFSFAVTWQYGSLLRYSHSLIWEAKGRRSNSNVCPSVHSSIPIQLRVVAATYRSCPDERQSETNPSQNYRFISQTYKRTLAHPSA